MEGLAVILAGEAVIGLPAYAFKILVQNDVDDARHRVGAIGGTAATRNRLDAADKLPVFMAATPEFVDQHPNEIVKYLKAWLKVGQDFKKDPAKAADAIYAFYTSKGYKMSKETFAKALSAVDVDPGFPADLTPYMQGHAESLLKAKRIKEIPDWNKALRPEFMKKAMA